MNKLRQSLLRLGCLTSLIAPIAAAIVYPKANWLFAFPLLGIALVVIATLTRKDPTPSAVADFAERLLNGTYQGWDVDNYEHLNPKGKALKDLWARTMGIGGLPEEWVNSDDETKSKIRELIAEIRQLQLRIHESGAREAIKRSRSE